MACDKGKCVVQMSVSWDQIRQNVRENGNRKSAKGMWESKLTIIMYVSAKSNVH